MNPTAAAKHGLRKLNKPKGKPRHGFTGTGQKIDDIYSGLRENVIKRF